MHWTTAWSRLISGRYWLISALLRTVLIYRRTLSRQERLQYDDTFRQTQHPAGSRAGHTLLCFSSLGLCIGSGSNCCRRPFRIGFHVHISRWEDLTIYMVSFLTGAIFPTIYWTVNWFLRRWVGWTPRLMPMHGGEGRSQLWRRHHRHGGCGRSCFASRYGSFQSGRGLLRFYDSSL